MKVLTGPSVHGSPLCVIPFLPNTSQKSSQSPCRPLRTWLPSPCHPLPAKHPAKVLRARGLLSPTPMTGQIKDQEGTSGGQLEALLPSARQAPGSPAETASPAREVTDRPSGTVRPSSSSPSIGPSRIVIVRPPIALQDLARLSDHLPDLRKVCREAICRDEATSSQYSLLDSSSLFLGVSLHLREKPNPSEREGSTLARIRPVEILLEVSSVRTLSRAGFPPTFGFQADGAGSSRKDLRGIHSLKDFWGGERRPIPGGGRLPPLLPAAHSFSPC
ncbi:uncharacterized protein LOC114816478 isoform X2 [Ornithorhynchus anatinus]|uniref:uncharacterized protein LOC114816478 isoform X2 n=1 Tax=Ornithorhynchus anatinus TaxID=9258 RepID=UPI0010A819EA|nr:uncharacterized protein LOC114816478 isoform X2 [Ornithorhynchus anatinus]